MLTWLNVGESIKVLHKADMMRQQHLEARQQEEANENENNIGGVLASLGLSSLLPSFRKRAINDLKALMLLDHDTMAQYMPEVEFGDRLKILDFIRTKAADEADETSTTQQLDRGSIAALFADLLVSHDQKRADKTETGAIVAGLLEENNARLLAEIDARIDARLADRAPAITAGGPLEPPAKRRAQGATGGGGPGAGTDSASLWLEDDDGKISIGANADTDLYRAGEGVLATSGALRVGSVDTCDESESAAGTVRFSVEKEMLQVCAKGKWNSAGAAVFDAAEGEPCNDDTAGSFQWDKDGQIHSRCANGVAAWKYSVRVGADDADCTASNAGAIRFQDGAFDACARRDSAEDFSRLKALHCTAMDWTLIPAYCFALPFRTACCGSPCWGSRPARPRRRPRKWRSAPKRTRWPTARRDSAEDFSRLNALLFTAMAWIFIPACCFANL